MLKINILSGSMKNPFYAHWDKKRYPCEAYYICENSNESILWDIVVVYENTKCPITVKCRRGGLIYVAGEPPMMRPLPNTFLKQFDHVVIPNIRSRHPHKLLSHGFLNWSLGVNFRTKQHRYDFESLKNIQPAKTKNISIVTSNKKMMPGHNRRMSIMEKLKRDFPGQIDFFGAGHNPVDYKADALLPYKFHICMENSCIPYYWTEKFSDPVLAYSVPIYLGCTNIDTYFDKRGYITFSSSNYVGLKQTISDILAAPQKCYEKYLPYLKVNRERIMNEENLIPFIVETYISQLQDNEVKEYTIRNIQSFKSYKPTLWWIRAKRFLFKIFYNIPVFTH
ncbi:hypothetical protein EVD33_13685 [Bacteroidales bacterium SW292]|nr:hypothetical protein [Bacteroidales bacterium SW292]